MEKNMEKKLHENVVQRELKPMNGILMLILTTVGLIAAIALIIAGAICLDDGAEVIGAILLIAGVIGCTVEWYGEDDLPHGCRRG